MLLVKRYLGWVAMSPKVKVFGCRPLTTVRRHGRPASENLRGRKPRIGEALAVGWARLWGFGWRACSVEVGWTRSVRRAGKIERRDGLGLEGAGAVER